MTWLTMTPDERRIALKPLWEAGYSASVCGEKLGTTKNAIIGLVGRAGRDWAHPGWDSMVGKRRAAIPNKTKIMQIKIAAPQIVPPRRQGISIMDLPHNASHKCRWPLWPVGDGYCGAECGDKVYCSEHAAIAFTPVDKSKMSRARY